MSDYRRPKFCGASYKNRALNDYDGAFGEHLAGEYKGQHGRLKDQLHEINS